MLQYKKMKGKNRISNEIWHCGGRSVLQEIQSLKYTARTMGLRQGEKYRRNTLISFFVFPNFLPAHGSLVKVIQRSTPPLQKAKKAGKGHWMDWEWIGPLKKNQNIFYYLFLTSEFKVHQGRGTSILITADSLGLARVWHFPGTQ